MNNLELKGNSFVYGRKIPNILGGFGKGKKSMLAQDIARFHRKELKIVNQAINMNKDRFRENVDLINLKNSKFVVNLVDQEILNQNAVNRSANIYLLSERGYAKLIKIFNDDLSWEIYDRLLDDYFEIKEKVQPESQLDILRGMIDQLESTQRKAEEAKQIAENIKDTIIHTDKDWRNWVNEQLNKIAFKNKNYKEIRKQSYDILENRARCRLSIRLDNLRDRLIKAGATETAANKACKLDVIESKPRLKEIYTTIVKEMSIKYTA